jgi:hypothetical protein|tara:strand:- start:387 stop:1067 length:681 start_codon:yes stop_codon:yes gene_type:complete
MVIGLTYTLLSTLESGSLNQYRVLVGNFMKFSLPHVLILCVSLLSGCAVIAPGNTINARAMANLPENSVICVRPASATATTLNANDALATILSDAGIKASCEANTHLLVWAYAIGGGQQESMTMPGSSSSVSSTACAGGTCSGSSVGSSVPAMTIVEVTYARRFQANLYAGSEITNPDWMIDISSRGESRSVKRLMKSWGNAVVEYFGSDVDNLTLPKTGIDLLID